MRAIAGVLLLTVFVRSTVSGAEELSVPVEYHGEQIQLAGRFEKPGHTRPVAHSDPFAQLRRRRRLALPSSRAPLMWAQGYATLRLDSFTARGYHNVCDNPGQVRPGERAQDVFTAAFLLAARPDVRTDKIAVLGLSHGGGTAIYLARDHEELRPWRERLATRHGKLVASVALYGGCGSSASYPVIIPLLALLGGRDDWTPAAPCVTLANAQANGIMQAVVYPEAYHPFDAASGIEKPHSAYGHLLAYNPGATVDAHKRVPEFLSRYLH